jgi:hydrogenase/urease accessory protein HupE
MISQWKSLCLIWLLLLLPAAAHQLGVETVTLEELGQNRYALRYAVPAREAAGYGKPLLPEHCTWEESSGFEAGPERLTFLSSDRSLSAEDVLIFPWRQNGIMVTAWWLDGSTAREVFMSDGEKILVPLSELRAGAGSLGVAARRYTRLGFEHILEGIDHLLFVAGLLLLVSGWKKLVGTITAFTLAHSITLALAVLGWASIPGEIVEPLIALSIVFLAVEIVHARRGQGGLAHRYPWLVSFFFGLIHGLGFAGALNSLGLPPKDVPAALFFFNTGVELGQLAFVAVCLGLGWVARKLKLRWPRQLELAPAYVVGTVAACWFLERSWEAFAY